MWRMASHFASGAGRSDIGETTYTMACLSSPSQGRTYLENFASKQHPRWTRYSPTARVHKCCCYEIYLSHIFSYVVGSARSEDIVSYGSSASPLGCEGRKPAPRSTVKSSSPGNEQSFGGFRTGARASARVQAHGCRHRRLGRRPQPSLTCCANMRGGWPPFFGTSADSPSIRLSLDDGGPVLVKVRPGSS